MHVTDLFPVGRLEGEGGPWNVFLNMPVSLNGGDWAKELICRTNKKIDGLHKNVSADTMNNVSVCVLTCQIW